MRRFVGRGPVWLTAAAAVGCVAAGVVLTLRPFTSVEVLVLVVGIGAIVTGALTVSSAGSGPAHRTLVGGGWVALGVGVLVWPGVTLDALAPVVGAALVVHGVADVARGLTGRGAGAPRADARIADLLGGLTSVAMGALAIAWPDVTVFVVAVLFGIRTLTFGVAQLVGLVRLHGHPPDRAGVAPAPPGRVRRGSRLAGHSIGLVGALALFAVSVSWQRDERAIPAFYATPEEVPDEPGILLRFEPYTTAIPDGAEAWLILYSTSDSLGEPAVGSAIVAAPRQRATDPRPVVAWTHGTVGIDRRCAPSLSPNAFWGVPLDHALAEGWVMVAPDYVGMGTAGHAPYLIGSGQASSTLDAVRAAHQLSGLDLSDQTVIWGHSQGGHAALWTGMLAPTYAPELDLAGVAAISPATDLVTQAEVVEGHLGAALGSAFVITAYSRTYADVDFDDYVRPGARVALREAASRCLLDPSLLLSIVTTLPASQPVFAIDPTSGPAGERLAANTPTAEMPTPLLIAQGTADEVIPFPITEAWVAEQCATGAELELVAYDGHTHMSVLDPTSGLPDRLTEWTADRLAGQAPADTCPATP